MEFEPASAIEISFAPADTSAPFYQKIAGMLRGSTRQARASPAERTEIVLFGNPKSFVAELFKKARRRAGGDYGVMPRPELGLPALRPFEEFVRCQ